MDKVQYQSFPGLPLKRNIEVKSYFIQALQHHPEQNIWYLSKMEENQGPASISVHNPFSILLLKS